MMEFVPNNIYHVYNRGNNSQPIFFERENYLFFLKKIRNHLSPFVEILAYCLMPNHFHLLVFIPESDSGLDLKSNPEFVINQKINNSIGIILRSYTRAINKKFNRTGSLFQKGTKAKK
ncbi:MAG: transposase, partial [Cyclobacteriaceae bacterium]|nr:transposase [Cyclobacteriaceae bacterium]